MPVAAQISSEGTFRLRRLLSALQLVATLLILAFVPGNWLKLVLLLLVWIATFRGPTPRELLCYVAVCALFAAMDILAVRQGVFLFAHPDVAGLPVWEYFMWGFYVLHVTRLLGGPPPPARLRLAAPLAIAFALPFSTLQDPRLLLLASGAALGLALLFFHEPWDLAYAGYTLLVGALVEYAGVWSGQWHYPDDPPGGVAFWFLTMWAGIGLFIRRLIVPLLAGAFPRTVHAGD